ncbi:MAG: UbiX family flavin prenyltransferase [Rhodothalassiaceae bacterium]
MSVKESDSRLILGLSGASGAVYGLCLIELLAALNVAVHLVISRAGALTLKDETGLKPEDLSPRVAKLYPPKDVGAAIASGSFKTMGMIVAPCSMRSAAEIAAGTTQSLLTRAADVVLKERRPLVLMVRETPLHLGHLRTLTALAEIGAVIAPPLPAFYAKPADLNAMVQQSCGRVLDLFGLDADGVSRWQGLTSAAAGRASPDQ